MRGAVRASMLLGAALILALIAPGVVLHPQGSSAPPLSAAAAVEPVAARPLIVRGATWYLRDSLSSGTATSTFSYGNPGDLPISGDWDGNGTLTPGVVRAGTWYLRNSNTTGVADSSFSYGDSGDTPVVGDWDGNGTYTPGVVRGDVWYLRNSNSSGVADVVFSFGNPGDLPIAGDWTAKGSFSPGVIRAGTWYLRNSNTTGVADSSFSYGDSGDTPVVGDWNGNGTTTPGVLRAGTWYLRNSNTSGVADTSFSYGDRCDVGLVTGSALARDPGGRALPPSLVGTNLSRLPTSDRVVALTFDAGGDSAGVGKILATLQTQCVPATFFMTGRWAQAYSQDARTIGLRYPTGNHTFSHPDLTTLGDDQVRAEVLAGQSAVQAAAAYNPRPLFRFPFGAVDQRTLGIVNRLGYASVYWTVDTLGWKGTSGGQSASTVVARVLANLQPGEIVLMHVGANPDDHTTLDADALPTIISELRTRGYTFVLLTSVL